MKFDVNEDKMDNGGMDYHNNFCIPVHKEHMFCRHTLQLLEVRSVCLKNKSVCSCV